MKKLILLFAPILLTGCIMDYTDYRMSVINNSQARIAVEVSNDTTKRTNNEIAYYISESIAPSDTSLISKSGENAWLEYIKQSKSKSLYIYVFSTDSLAKYQRGGADMSYLPGNKKYLKRLEYSLDELTATNWQIMYK
ncbi:hypothetical protein [Mucilaginibacter celer]|uniref:Lipoprotein n=1 Tax=Mucilaginibacter celer TaxID=2305508 RepID=A0A494W5K7_9SPHI|nr:hypothetical protein [Mucilaginibacter celer]AYL98582.1 hypothetical protein HYN43_026365 [Mucilaginibacter celer]